MTEKPTAAVEERWQTCQIKFKHEARRFAVDYGYKHYSGVQIRLEDNGDVYLSSSDETRYPDKIIATRVLFDVFARELPAFIKHLNAVAAEAMEKP